MGEQSRGSGQVWGTQNDVGGGHRWVPFFWILKGGPGNRGRSACGPTHVARLEFPLETGLMKGASLVAPTVYR